MFKKNDVSVNIHNNVTNSEIIGGKIRAVSVDGVIGENKASINIGGSVNDSSVIGGRIDEFSDTSKLGEEIQQLLSELSEDPRTAKEAVAIEAIKAKIKDKPVLRQKLLSALKSGGIEALKVIFDHPFISIPVETVKGFLEAGE